MPVRDGMSIVRRRNLADADAVATGVGGANILQRFRLNSKVALITGTPLLAHFITLLPLQCATVFDARHRPAQLPAQLRV